MVLKPLRFCSRELTRLTAPSAVDATCEMVCLFESAVLFASLAVLTVASRVLACSVILVERPLAVCYTAVALLIAPEAVFDTSATWAVMLSEVCFSALVVA